MRTLRPSIKIMGEFDGPKADVHRSLPGDTDGVGLSGSSMSTAPNSIVNDGLALKARTTSTGSASGRSKKDAAMSIVHQSPSASITVSGSSRRRNSSRLCGRGHDHRLRGGGGDISSHVHVANRWQERRTQCDPYAMPGTDESYVETS